MTATEFDRSEEPKDQLTLLEESVNHFDELEKAYFNACADYFERPTDHNLGILAKVAESHTNAFDSTIEALLKDAPLDEMALMSRGFIKRADECRSAFLNAITNEEITEKLGDNFDVKLLDWIDEEDENEARRQLADFVEKVFSELVVSDTGKLIEACSHTLTAKRIRLAEMSRGHALDVGKLALGAFIGAWAARRLSR